MKVILRHDFDQLSSDSKLGIIQFGSLFKDEFNLILALKQKLMDTKINDLTVKPLMQFMMALSNLHMNGEPDIALMKKLFDENHYYLVSFHTWRELDILIDIFTYLKQKLPMFFHFFGPEAMTFMTTINRKAYKQVDLESDPVVSESLMSM